MAKNAWKVANPVAARIDDAPPVHSEYTKCTVAEKPDDGLFFNHEYCKKYFQSKTAQGRLAIPGSGYMSMTDNFRSTHYECGELYMKYLKGDCGRLSQKNFFATFVRSPDGLVLLCNAFHVYGQMNQSLLITIILVFLTLQLVLIVPMMTGSHDTISRRNLKIQYAHLADSLLSTKTSLKSICNILLS